MSGSSRHGSARPPAAAGRRPGAREGGGDNGHAKAAADAERLAGLLEPVVSATGMDLEGVRITSAGRRRLLRIVVDADGGVSLDDIAQVSRDLSVVLDDDSALGSQPYTLEVSSPGVDRPLTERRHWRRAIGRLVVAPLTGAGSTGTNAAANGTGGASGASSATVEGRITGASADAITLDVGGESRQFGYGDLGPGKIKIEFAPIDAGPDDEDTDGEGADEEGSDGY